jgi:hypothetical protein
MIWFGPRVRGNPSLQRLYNVIYPSTRGVPLLPTSLTGTDTLRSSTKRSYAASLPLNGERFAAFTLTNQIQHRLLRMRVGRDRTNVGIGRHTCLPT